MLAACLTVMTAAMGQGRKARYADGIPLSVEEAALVDRFFGLPKMTKKIRKHLREDNDPIRHDSLTAGQVEGMHAFFFGRNASRDFLQDSLEQAATFFHEIGHIWQLYARTPHSRDTGYRYTLTPETKFRNLGLEQQAAALDDYFRIHLYTGDKIRPTLTIKRWGVQTPEQDALLTAFIEKRFPLAKALRLEAEAVKAAKKTQQKPAL